jgi:C1A family cysteine protease
MKHRILTLCLLLAALMAGPAFAGDRDETLQHLREEIRQKGYSFQVEDNPALDFPLDVLCGLVEPSGWRRHARFVDFTAKVDLPAAFDWRDLNGCTSIKNQGGCGGCWAFSTVGALECQILLQELVEEDLSEQFLVSCDNSNNGCSGGWFAHNFHITEGAVREICFPYTAADDPCIDTCPRPYFVESWAYIGNSYSVPTTEAIKQAIYDYGPVCAAVAVSSSFQAYSGGVYDADDTTDINHAIMLVGWDDDQGCWILRNSWGPGWGEDGYMRIAYGSNRVGYAANFITYVPVSQPLIDIAEVQPDSGAGGNGRLDADEAADLSVLLRNDGALAGNVQATLSTDDPYVSVIKDQADYGDIPRGEIRSGQWPFQVSIAADVPVEHSIDFQLAIAAGGGYIQDLSFSVLANLASVLVLDLDGNTNSGPALAAALEANGLPAHYATGYEWSSLTDFEAVFLCLGVYSQNHVLTSAEGDALADFLDGGGALYMEGGDTWTYDPSTAVHPYFHASGTADGTSDLSVLEGQSGTLWEGLSLAYDGDNNYIDHLAATGDGQLIFANDSPAYGTAVAHDAGLFRTIGSSFEFGGLVDGVGDNTPAAVMARMMAFLGIAPQGSGDLDENGVLDATDLHILASFLAGSSAQLPGDSAAADCNGDGEVDLCDLMALLCMLTEGA